MVDCHACELDAEVSTLVAAGEYSEAIKAAKPIMSGKVGCPHRTTAGPLPTSSSSRRLSQGRLNKAGEAFERGYPQVAGNPDFLSHRRLASLLPSRERSTSPADCGSLSGICRGGAKRIIRPSGWRSTRASALFFERLAGERPKPRKVRIP